MPRWLRRLGWTAAFGAIGYRLYTGLSKLDDPVPQEQPASWPPLSFESSPEHSDKKT